MKNGFKNLTIQHIQLEERSQLAEVEVQFTEGKILIETIMVLGSTDLNMLLAKLSAKGVSLALTEDFEHFSTEEGELYSLDFEKKGWSEIVIDDFVPLQRVRQIRA
ncbi:hypothetical protein CW751_12975 [Brumimicrobium salinarum]|uniref:Uncharacterized protein n=1 Tax=Brumimicrobium salinarum TaxID=2058658 RepID=A0A2I0QZU0_9FLAO|nr:hypothetical protein [Brumimicrobium salinarum]PKR79862.1 hypothetical protein CW751_12975 [Brumimicrobium salinarum]